MKKNTDLKFTEDELLKLKEALPKLYAGVLQKQIKRKYKRTVHVSTIYRGLTYEHQSDMIITEAKLLAEKNLKNKASIGNFVEKIGFRNRPSNTGKFPVKNRPIGG